MAIENKRMYQLVDTAANWTANNPILGAGEIGYSSDDGVLKVGDGATTWNNLATHSQTGQNYYDATTVGTTTYTVLDSDNNKTLIANNASQVTLDFPDSLASGFHTRAVNIGGGGFAITASGTAAIRGTATTANSDSLVQVFKINSSFFQSSEV